MTKFHKQNFALRGLTLLLALSAPALQLTAHHVWLEPTEPEGLILRFGEGDTTETSPGYLDNFTAPTAWSSDAVEIEMLRRERDGYYLKGSDAATPAFFESSYTLYGKETKVYPFFYARWHVPGADSVKSEPAFDLDIVPTGNENEFCVYFHGEPVPNANVEWIKPTNEIEELNTDANGLLQVETSGAGLYMLSLHKSEERKGQVGGQTYGKVSHVAATAWTVPADAASE